MKSGARRKDGEKLDGREDSWGVREEETNGDKKENERGGGAPISHLLKTQCLKQVITHLLHVPLTA